MIIVLHMLAATTLHGVVRFAMNTQTHAGEPPAVYYADIVVAAGSGPYVQHRAVLLLDTIVQVTPGYQHRALQDIFAQ